jgi:hypothetical protein
VNCRVHVSRHSGADIDVSITGYVAPGDVIDEVFVAPKEFDECVAVRVMNIFRAVKGGVDVTLFWDGSDTPILPLEGYGNMDLNKFNGLVNPREEGWTGGIRVRASSLNGGYFTISLELSKQRT